MRIGINAQLLSFANSYRQAGLSRYIYELLARLPAVEPDSEFVAFVPGGPIPGEFASHLSQDLTLVRSRLPTGKAPVRIGWEQAVLPAAATVRRLDLLHCTVNVRPFVSPCPTVVTVHDLIFLRYPQRFKPAKRRYLKAMTGWSVRHASHVIAVSDATRRDTIELLGVRPGRVTTVHNGAGEQFAPVGEQARSEFRLRHNLQGRVVLYVGTLEPRKNLTTLLQSFAALITDERLQDTRLLIGGSKGWYYEEVFHMAKQLGLIASGRVRFLGRVPDEELPLWYNVASVFVYPSLYEGFGLPALEAMACGAPVVVSNTSSFPEVVGDAGILLDPNDGVALTEGMRRVLVEPELAQKMSRQGIERAKQFSWDRTGRETSQVYRRVLAQNL